MPTWLKITLNILLNVVLVVCAVLFTIYTYVFDKYKKYTYQDLQDAYNTGYAQASAVVADLQAKINELTESLTQKMQQVSDLQLQISDLQNKNFELETDKQALEQQILELQNLVSQKDSEIADLKAEIERLKAELEIYANQELDFVYVTFYVDNEVYKTVSVRKEGSILVDIEEPTKEGYVFNNWTDGSNVVDLKSCVFSENTSLYADFSRENARLIVNVSLIGFTDDYLSGFDREIIGRFYLFEGDRYPKALLQWWFYFGLSEESDSQGDPISWQYYFGTGTNITRSFVFDSLSIGSYRILARAEEYEPITMSPSNFSDYNFEINNVEDDIVINLIYTYNA